jgi:hypothetical protein
MPPSLISRGTYSKFAPLCVKIFILSTIRATLEKFELQLMIRFISSTLGHYLIKFLLLDNVYTVE